MDSQATLDPRYIASSARVGIRPWNRRKDRGQIERWPSYSPTLPVHWLAAPPVTGERVTYAADLLSVSPADRLVGRISLVCQGDTARLGIALHPGHLGVGIGTEAMGLMIEVGRQLGLVAIRLDVASENTRARRCYARVGFVECGVSWRDGYGYLDMELRTGVVHASGSAIDFGDPVHAAAG